LLVRVPSAEFSVHVHCGAGSRAAQANFCKVLAWADVTGVELRYVAGQDLQAVFLNHVDAMAFKLEWG
jgi:hypothetical protein